MIATWRRCPLCHRPSRADPFCEHCRSDLLEVPVTCTHDVARASLHVHALSDGALSPEPLERFSVFSRPYVDCCTIAAHELRGLADHVAGTPGSHVPRWTRACYGKDQDSWLPGAPLILAVETARIDGIHWRRVKKTTARSGCLLEGELHSAATIFETFVKQLEAGVRVRQGP